MIASGAGRKRAGGWWADGPGETGAGRLAGGPEGPGETCRVGGTLAGPDVPHAVATRPSTTRKRTGFMGRSLSEPRRSAVHQGRLCDPRTLAPVRS